MHSFDFLFWGVAKYGTFYNLCFPNFVGMLYVVNFIFKISISVMS